VIPFAYSPDAIGTNIKLRREQLGLSQQTVAGMVGTSQAAVSNHEGGKRTLKLETMVKYATALNMRIVITKSGIWMEGERW
jgi:transcriptional regulator with XRE-family HTH domain